jgi:hypothetical protein
VPAILYLRTQEQADTCFQLAVYILTTTQQRSEAKSTRLGFFSAVQELAKMCPPSVPRPKYSLLRAGSSGSRLTGASMAHWRQGGTDRRLPAGGMAGGGRAPPPTSGPAARGDFFFLPGDDGATKPPCRLPANGIGEEGEGGAALGSLRPPPQGTGGASS